MSREFVKAALLRALRTVCQAFLGYLGAASLLSEVHWVEALSSAALAGIMSLVTSVATGLPEV